MSRRRSKWDVQASEVTTESNNGSPKSATEAARERAAKLTAMLAAKGKLANSAGTPLPVMSQAVSQPSQKVDKEQDLLYAEVEINDSPARAILCKGTTQDEINKYSGAAISTKGRYMDAEEKKNLNDGEKPLYLCIQATTQEKIECALKRIHEIKNGADIHGTPPQEQTSSHTRWSPYQSTTTTVNNTNASIAATITQQQNQTLPSGMHYIQDKVFVGLEHASPDFNVKDKLLGPGGSYFQHICTETGAKVFLRGKGSGFLEPTSGREAFEALHIYISHTKSDGLSAARKLVENLIQTVNNEFQTFEQRKRGPQPGYPPHPGYPQPGYMHPSYGYPPGMNQPPAGYLPPPPVGPMVPPYGHIPPIPLQPLPPHGQMMPPGYRAPHQPAPRYPEPLMPGGTQNGGPTPYPPNMPCPPRPDLPPGAYNGSQHQPPPPVNQPHPQLPKEETPKDVNKRNLERPPDITQPEPPKRRFKEVPHIEPQQSSKSRTSKKESSREASYLGIKKEKMSSQPSLPQQAPKKDDNTAMPPPPLPVALMPPPKLQSKTTSDQKDFKKPLGLAKQFTPPPPPKVILGSQQKPSLSGTGSKKHGLPSPMDNPEPKKAKREESEDVSSYSAIGSLVAYEGDSSEEEDEHLEPATSSKLNKNSSTSRSTKQQQNLPFWAFQK